MVFKELEELTQEQHDKIHRYIEVETDLIGERAIDFIRNLELEQGSALASLALLEAIAGCIMGRTTAGTEIALSIDDANPRNITIAWFDIWLKSVLEQADAIIAKVKEAHDNPTE